MTILFFTRLFYPHIGGVEKHIYEIGKRLNNKGHKVIIVTEQLPRNITASIKLDEFEIYRIPVGKSESNKKYKIWNWLWQHRQLLKNADIIHAHDVFFWYLPFRFLYFRKKIFTTFHGYETIYPPRRKAILMRKISEKLSLGNICVGDFIKKWYKTQPNFVTYGGVETTNLIKKNNSRQNKLNILFIGRLEEDTGGFIYDEVLNILNNNNVPFMFTAVGDGSLRKLFERSGKVKGFVSNVVPYLANADIVFSSSYLSILQSLYLKKRVISVYDNPLKKDYLMMSPFSKWIYVDDDPIQITHEIMRYQNKSTNYNEKNEQAFKWAQEQTWDKVIEKYLKLWEIE